MAELSRLPAAPVAPEVLVQRRRSLPAVDPARLRRDLDAIVDSDI